MKQFTFLKESSASLPSLPYHNIITISFVSFYLGCLEPQEFALDA